MTISIILINFNTPQITKECLDLLIQLKSKLNLDIIVIDNGSTDNSVKILQSSFNEEISFIKNSQNLGFASANNQGAAIAKGEYLVFLNSDILIDDDFISPCINILEKNKSLGAVSPQLLNIDRKLQKSAFGVFPSIGRLITQKTKKDPTLQFINNYALVDWISGCAFIIKKTIFNQINGWDSNFFLYYEDIDICKNLRCNSHRVAVCKNSNIVHLGGQSLKSEKVKRNHFYKSQDYYFSKWHGEKSMYLVQLFRSLYKVCQRAKKMNKKI